jgi:CRP-like cAMP-binding protein
VPIDAGNGTVAMAPLAELDLVPTEEGGFAGGIAAVPQPLVPVLSLPPGEWSPSSVRPAASRPFVLLIVEGLLVHDLRLADSAASELLGPGDVASPRARDGFVPVATRWTVAEPVRIALLDARLTPALQRTPLLASGLLAQAADQCARMAVHRAIVQLPRVEDRLLALFGHLAERWGRVGAAGLIVPMRLTHEMIGRLVGARRPTVSLGIKGLAEQDSLTRRDDGSWLIAAGALDTLAAAAQPLERMTSGADLLHLAVPATAPTAAAAGHRMAPEDRMMLLRRAQRLRGVHATHLFRSREILERSRAAREEATSVVRRARALAAR